MSVAGVGSASKISLPKLLLDPMARARVRPQEVAARIARIRQDPEWAAIQAALMRQSPAYFAQELLSGPPQPPYNGRFLVADHHLAWDQLITQHKRLCVEAPRDHSKTFFFDFAYPLWKSFHAPNGVGFIFSATRKQADRILGDIKTEIENNPKLRHLYPQTAKRRWSDSFIRLSNGHRIYARGFGTKVRGAHPDWVIVDDGINDESAYSEMVRTKEIEYFYTAITNMVVPGGQIIVVGTPFHGKDLYGDLERNPSYTFRRFQALGPGNRPLWPARYSRKALLAKQREIGTVRFAREFQCVPVSDEMSLFPDKLFRGDPTEQRMVQLGLPLEYWVERGVTPYIGVDLALSSNVGADYTVIWVMGADGYGNRWIIDIFRAQGMPYQEQLSRINTYGQRYQPALVVIEANQAQRIFGDELIRTTDLPIRLYTTGAEKNALDRGVPALRVLLENHKFRIPRGDAQSVEKTDIWIEEMHNFTYTNGKLQSVGGHDDTCMALWLCNNGINMGGFNFTFGEADPATKPHRYAKPSAGETPAADAALVEEFSR